MLSDYIQPALGRTLEYIKSSLAHVLFRVYEALHDGHAVLHNHLWRYAERFQSSLAHARRWRIVPTTKNESMTRVLEALHDGRAVLRDHLWPNGKHIQSTPARVKIRVLEVLHNGREVLHDCLSQLESIQLLLSSDLLRLPPFFGLEALQNGYEVLHDRLSQLESTRLLLSSDLLPQ